MTESLQSWVSTPQPLIRSLAIPFLVYFATYATFNCLDTFYAANDCKDQATASSAKLVATTGIGIGACVYKDVNFVKMASRAPVRPLTYALFTARDAFTSFAALNLPPIVAATLGSFPSVGPSQGQTAFQSDESRLRAAQMIAPVASQLVSTPIHLLGLDMHNRQHKVTVRDRLKVVWKHTPFATPLRMVRMIPAFGVGSAINTGCRTSMLRCFN